MKVAMSKVPPNEKDEIAVMLGLPRMGGDRLCQTADKSVVSERSIALRE